MLAPGRGAAGSPSGRSTPISAPIPSRTGRCPPRSRRPSRSRRLRARHAESGGALRRVTPVPAACRRGRRGRGRSRARSGVPRIPLPGHALPPRLPPARRPRQPPRARRRVGPDRRPLRVRATGAGPRAWSRRPLRASGGRLGCRRRAAEVAPLWLQDAVGPGTAARRPLGSRRAGSRPTAPAATASRTRPRAGEATPLHERLAAGAGTPERGAARRSSASWWRGSARGASASCAGYTLRREPLNADYSGGVENVGVRRPGGPRLARSSRARSS